MNKPRLYIAAAAVLAVIVPGGLKWYHGTQQSQEPRVTSQAESLADLIKKLDGIKLAGTTSGQGSGILTKAGLERLLAQKAGLTVEELRSLIASGTQSTDPLDRARAHLLKSDYNAALKAIAAVKAIHPDDLLATLEVKAQAYEGQSRHEDSLAARRKIAGLTDKKKDPAAWAAAQRMVTQASAAADKRRTQEPLQPEAGATDPPPASHNLPNTPDGQGESAAAKTDQRPAPATLAREPSQEEIQTLQSQSNLADTLTKQGKYAEAEAAARDLLSTCERVLGPNHRDTLTAWGKIALTLQMQGKKAEGEEILRAVVNVLESVAGPEHSETLFSRGKLAAALSGQGKIAEADEILRDVLARSDRVLGPEHPQTQRSHSMIAMNLAAQGDGENKAGNRDAARACWTEALEHARTAYAVGQRILASDSQELAIRRSVVTRLEAKLSP